MENKPGFLVTATDGTKVWLDETNIHEVLNELSNCKRLEKFHIQVLKRKQGEIHDLTLKVARLKQKRKEAAKRYFEKHILPTLPPKEDEEGMYEARVPDSSRNHETGAFRVRFKGQWLDIEFPVFRFYAKNHKQAMNFLHHRKMKFRILYLKKV